MAEYRRLLRFAAKVEQGRAILCFGQGPRLAHRVLLLARRVRLAREARARDPRRLSAAQGHRAQVSVCGHVRGSLACLLKGGGREGCHRLLCASQRLGQGRPASPRARVPADRGPAGKICVAPARQGRQTPGHRAVPQGWQVNSGCNAPCQPCTGSWQVQGESPRGQAFARACRDGDGGAPNARAGHTTQDHGSQRRGNHAARHGRRVRAWHDEPQAAADAGHRGPGYRGDAREPRSARRRDRREPLAGQRLARRRGFSLLHACSAAALRQPAPRRARDRPATSGVRRRSRPA
mmetsp:Transcript_21159/g.60195  ORF Transcript_21159/g.60195 Transcript_21159/m.60195 type:complete len:293 (-) Transcript_21159:397-1275(-)